MEAPLLVVPTLSTLTAKSILAKLNRNELDILLKEASRIYRLSFKRYRWDEEKQDWTILVEEGIVGTYTSRQALMCALEAHKQNINEKWWNEPFPHVGTHQDTTILKNGCSENNPVYELCSKDAQRNYADQEIRYCIEPLLNV